MQKGRPTTNKSSSSFCRYTILSAHTPCPLLARIGPRTRRDEAIPAKSALAANRRRPRQQKAAGAAGRDAHQPPEDEATCANDKYKQLAIVGSAHGPDATSFCSSATTDDARRAPARRRRPLSGRHDSRAALRMSLVLVLVQRLVHGMTLHGASGAFVRRSCLRCAF